MPHSDWDAKLYDTKHSFVTEYGEAVVALLDPKPGERILDVGCGTGHLTKKIHDLGAEVVGIDPSDNMIRTARESYPDITFIQADATNLRCDEPFDAIFSNAALHWVTHAEEAVQSFARVLKPGGRFVVEFGGKGNIQRLISALFTALEEQECYGSCHRWYFPSISEYGSLLEKHGIEPRTMWLFDRPTPLEGADGLRNWYAQFGDAVHTTADESCWNQAVERAHEILRPTLHSDEGWVADYRRLRVFAVRSN